MTPPEVWLFVEARTPERQFGRLRESEVDALVQLHDQYEGLG